MVPMIVLVSMVEATETGPREYVPGDTIEVPTARVQLLIERRIAKRPVAEKK